MGIGVGVSLLAIGAVLSFAVRDAIPGVSLEMVGFICMGAGVLALVFGLIQSTQRTNTSHKQTLDRDIA